MNSRTEYEIETMNNEFSMRISEKAILQLLDDYDDSEAVEKLLSLKKHWGKDNVLDTISECVGWAYTFVNMPLDKEDLLDAVHLLKKHCENHKCNNCQFGYKDKHCTLAFRPSSWSIKAKKEQNNE